MSQPQLRTHSIWLRDGALVLRPMTEDDWPCLLRWNNDPEVLYFSEGDHVSQRSLEEVQDIYRAVSQTALMFIIEVDGRPIGECWLQGMNLQRILTRFPELDCRRIDLVIGEKAFWGRGYGTRAIRLLTQLAFAMYVDAVFAVDVADYNTRSRRAFEKAGFRLFDVMGVPQPAKALRVYDFVIWREGGAPGRELLP